MPPAAAASTRQDTTNRPTPNPPQPGNLFTRGPGAYKIPSFNDVPSDFRVTLLKDATNPVAVHSAKAIGEPPFFLAASAFFAIKVCSFVSSVSLAGGV